MNAIRSLPLINRPSRTSTPAPATTVPVSGAAAVQPLGPPPIPDSRVRHSFHGAPIVSMPVGGTAPRSQSAKRVPSPPSRSATPRTSSTPLPPNAEAPTTPQGGGHMDAVGLRLNDAVNKAAIGVDYKLRKGFRSGAGWTVGESIARELPPPPADTYLLRAVLRTTVRALSIYVGRLDSLLLPALSDPLFASPVNLIPNAHTSPLNVAQTFAITVAHAAWETCEKLEQMLETVNYPRFVEDTLRPTMDKLDLVVGKVVRPLMLGIKTELEASLVRTDAAAHKPATPTVPIVTRELSNTGGTRLTKELSGGGHSRASAVPPCLQQFASRVDGARKALQAIAAPCGHDGEGWVAKVVVSIVWRGMRSITDKDTFQPIHGTPSPTTVHKALAGLNKEALPTVVASPSIAKITSLSILTPRGQSRPPSPPRQAAKFDPTTVALVAFEALIKRLVGGLVQPPTAAPTAVDETDQELESIAREALHEAIEALQSASVASAVVHCDEGSERILASVRRLRDDIDDEAEDQLDDALEDLPSVSLFNLILRRANAALAAIPSTEQATPLRLREGPELFNWAPAEYDRQVMSGFGPAEEWGPRVARAIKPEVERMMTALAGIMGSGDQKVSKEVAEATEWVRALGVALDARAGVNVPRAM